jgi:hypothetical protein
LHKSKFALYIRHLHLTLTSFDAIFTKAGCGRSVLPRMRVLFGYGDLYVTLGHRQRNKGFALCSFRLECRGRGLSAKQYCETAGLPSESATVNWYISRCSRPDRAPDCLPRKLPFWPWEPSPVSTLLHMTLFLLLIISRTTVVFSVDRSPAWFAKLILSFT